MLQFCRMLLRWLCIFGHWYDNLTYYLSGGSICIYSQHYYTCCDDDSALKNVSFSLFQWEIKEPSCFTGNPTFLVIRLVFGYIHI